MFSKDEFRHAVIEGIKRIRNVSDVTLRDDQEFTDIGLDSLDGMNLVLEVETQLGLNLGEFDLRGANTINGFHDKVKDIVSSQT